MKISGKNISVSDTADIITAGGILSEPTTERTHALVSTSQFDDYDGTPQIETATVAGTIAGQKQSTGLEVFGTVGSSGAGNVSVVVTGAQVAGSPLTIPVAVANNDTASQVAGKIRTALNVSAITTHYDISGTGANAILTAKVNADQDSTLEMHYTNGTASGLDENTSIGITIGYATGAGNIQVGIYSSLFATVFLNVAVAGGDNPSAIATKVRAALNSNATVTANYTVSGATDKVILTAKVGAANDDTLNIRVVNDTSHGLTDAETSADTTAGIAPLGARIVEVTGINNAGEVVKENVKLNGTAAVNTAHKYLFINSMLVKTAGTEKKNLGTITATAVTDDTVTSTIEIGRNKAQQAVYAAGSGYLSNLSISAVNDNEAVTQFDILTKKKDGVWIPEQSFQLHSGSEYFKDNAFYTLNGVTFFKIQATPSVGNSSVFASFDVS